MIEKSNQTKDSAIWLIYSSAPMAQKSKKAKPDDHETNDSAIRLICLFGSHGAKKAKKQRQMTMNPKILLFCLFTFSAPMSRGAKNQKQIRLFGFGPGEKAKAKKLNSAFWLIGGIPIGSKIGFWG